MSKSIFIIFNFNSKFLRALLAMVSKIKPQAADNIAASAKSPLTISVGIFGTSPVFKYSAKTGRNIKIDIAIKITAGQQHVNQGNKNTEEE